MNNPGKKHEGESASGGCDWSSLPVEILDIISEKLEHFRDRLNLASACKEWRIPVTPRPMPWLAKLTGHGVFSGTSRSVTITYEFREICCKRPCNLRPYKHSLLLPEIGTDHILVESKIKNPELGQLLRESLPLDTAISDDHFIVESGIIESKLGWLLVAVPHYRFRSEEFQLRWESLFVYHPFSARFISLPRLYPEEHYTVTFSGSDPTSPECVFFVIVWRGGKALKIHTWSPGQEVWKEKHVIMKDPCWRVVRSVTCLDGIFYWCSRKHMESFNLSNGERKKITLPSQFAGIDLSYHDTRLFELNGGMLLLVNSTLSTEGNHVFFEFDPFEESWIRRDDFLNDRLL